MGRARTSKPKIAPAPLPEGWAPATPAASITLDLAECRGVADAVTNLSAGTRIGDTLFVAADEALSVDRLVRTGDNAWTHHERLCLSDLLPLADPKAEADIEGLAADDGWLWVIGSHARTRPKPTKYDDECIDLAELADLKDTRARCLLARLPLVPDPDVAGGLLPVANDGVRVAGLVKQDKYGNALAEAMAADPLLAPFTKVPAKEGGIDVEGLAVAGDRIAVGMRGPTVAGNALMLEMRWEAKRSGRIKLDVPPFKRLLALEGLGIRDLKRCNDDLIILAGPTTAVSGPCVLYRWRGWVTQGPADRERVRLHRPERLFDIPYGRGVDHPEGLALWDEDGKKRILVLYDSPDPTRLSGGEARIAADLFDLPE